MYANKTYSQRLAEFAVKLRFEDLPENVIAIAKQSIMDNFGCMIAAKEVTSTKIVVDMVRSFGGEPQATIVGYWEKVPAPFAAYCNGTANHALEMDDHISHKRSFSHPGVVSVPPALALGEFLHISGKDFLTAVVLGYEITTRINRTIPPAFEKERGFHGTAVTGPFGATVLASRLLGLNSEEIAAALGITGSLAAGSFEFKIAGSWTKRLHAGVASKNGILAAMLAKRGFTGPNTILEGRCGFLNSYFGKDNYDISVLDKNLGKEWEINYIQYKPFACGGMLHSPATAALNLKKKHNLKADKISAIEVHTAAKFIKEAGEPFEIKANPRSVVDAQFSIPFTLALVFCNGSAMVDDYTEKYIFDKRIRDTANKVRYVVDPTVDKVWPKEEPCTIRVHTKDGRILTESVTCAKGSFEDPMNFEELIEKYRILSAKTLKSEQITKTIDFFSNLEKENDVAELFKRITTT